MSSAVVFTVCSISMITRLMYQVSNAGDRDISLCWLVFYTINGFKCSAEFLTLKCMINIRFLYVNNA